MLNCCKRKCAIVANTGCFMAQSGASLMQLNRWAACGVEELHSHLTSEAHLRFRFDCNLINLCHCWPTRNIWIICRPRRLFLCKENHCFLCSYFKMKFGLIIYSISWTYFAKRFIFLYLSELEYYYCLLLYQRFICREFIYWIKLIIVLPTTAALAGLYIRSYLWM